MTKLGVRTVALIDDLVAHYRSQEELFVGIHDAVDGYLTSSSKLKSLAHSFKSRIKNPEHLRDKLIRKALKAKTEKIPFSINKENLFLEINDAVGFRIIHLHTKQIEEIDTELKRIIKTNALILEGKPTAKTWDNEMEAYYKGVGMNIDQSLEMYTSVHYVIKPNSHLPITCEIQVRTLMEEVWGEVSHTVNYPHPTESLSCREQIKVLARVTSGCTRLVDSIFSTHDREKAAMDDKTTLMSTPVSNVKKTKHVKKN